MDELTKKKIGQRINTILAEKDIKQKDLAKVLGVSDNVVSYYVSGKRTPNLEQIIKLAAFFDVSTDYILGLSESSSVDITEREISNLTGINEAELKCLMNINGEYEIIFSLSNFEPVRLEGSSEHLKYYAKCQKCIIDIINYLLKEVDNRPNGEAIAKHLVSYKEKLLESSKAATEALEVLPELDASIICDFYDQIEHFNDLKQSEIFKCLSEDGNVERHKACLINILKAEKMHREAKYELFELVEDIKSIVSGLYDEKEENDELIAEIRKSYQEALTIRREWLIKNNKLDDTVDEEIAEE